MIQSKRKKWLPVLLGLTLGVGSYLGWLNQDSLKRFSPKWGQITQGLKAFRPGIVEPPPVEEPSKDISIVKPNPPTQTPDVYTAKVSADKKLKGEHAGLEKVSQEIVRLVKKPTREELISYHQRMLAVIKEIDDFLKEQQTPIDEEVR